MRYYIYLDKKFLKNIYSVMNDSSFSIDVLELSEENGVKITNHVNVEPGFEKSCDKNINDKQNKHTKGIDRSRTNICYGYSKTNDSKKIRRYINIQDVTDIKCLGFYHNLLEKLQSNNLDEKIIIERGVLDVNFFKQSRENNLDFENHNMFKINDSYICIDKSMLEINLNLLCYTNCNVTVLGYILNSCFNEKYKVIKAIAIYID